MDKKKGFTLTKTMAKVVASFAADKAIEAYQNEKRIESQKSHDKRYQNTKLLLQNYKKFVAYRDNAIYDTSQIIESSTLICELMESNPVGNYEVESIKKNVAITHTMLEHIDEMLGVYKNRCLRSSKPEVQRRWRIIEALYLVEDDCSTADVAEKEFVTEKTVYNDLNKSYEELSELFFGIDFNDMLL